MADTTTDSTSGSGKGRSMKEVSADIKDAGMDDTYPYPKDPEDPGSPNKTDDEQPPEPDTVVSSPKMLTDEQMNQDPATLLHPEDEANDLELPSEVDTALWNEAKDQVQKEMDIGEDDPRFYKEVQAIYQAKSSKEPTQ